MKEAPLLGQIVKNAGCLFVERRNRKQIKKEIFEITDGLRHGVNVCIFPEATSTPGTEVLRFRRPLYNAAIESGVGLLPACISYKSINGESLSSANKDNIFWYGDMDFLPHMWNLMGQKNIVVSLSIFPEFKIEKEMSDTFLAEQTHKIVSQHYQPPRLIPGETQYEA
jgi:1-acyl-sn-glycerol-3-phosphate acyltransferase